MLLRQCIVWNHLWEQSKIKIIEPWKFSWMRCRTTLMLQHQMMTNSKLTLQPVSFKEQRERNIEIKLKMGNSKLTTIRVSGYCHTMHPLIQSMQIGTDLYRVVKE